jgi:hypothetical protein
MTRISDMTPLAALPAAGGYVPVEVPGSNENRRYDLSKLTGFATRAAMAVHASPAVGDIVGLNESGRDGVFVVELASSWTAAIAADPEQIVATVSCGQGLFVPSTADPTKVYRRLVDGPYLSLWWGVSTTNTAAQNTAAFRAGLTALAAVAPTGHAYHGAGSVPYYTPAGTYTFNDELKPESAVEIYGDSWILGGGTVFVWTGSSGHGIHIQGWDGALYHGTGSSVHNLTLSGWYSVAADRAAQHGIYVNGQAHIANIFGGNWPGKLVYAFADVGASNGNVNLSTFRNIYGENSDLTLMLQGGDANACVVEGIQAQSNRFGSYWDWSFLGNAASKIHAENCGLDTNFRSRCEKSGHIYVVAYGQETWCSTNSPSGTTASNTGWLYLNDGPTNFYTATWVTGQTWYFTTPVSVGAPDNGNTLGRIEGAYIEGGMNPIVLAQNASCTTTTVAVIWQQSGARHGGTMRGDGPYMLFGNNLAWPGDTDAEGALHGFGPLSGTATSLGFSFNSTQNIVVDFNRYAVDGSLIANDGRIATSVGEMSINAVGKTYFRFNGTDVFTTLAGGLNLPTGKVLTVNAVQVVGARDTGWTADTGTARKAANATYAAGTTLTYSAAYVQAEQTAMATRMAAVEAALQNISQTQKSIKDLLLTHGLGGA